MQFTLEELNYMLNAVDTHVRANGIQGAAVGVSIADKLQIEAKAAGAAPGDNDEAANED